MPSPFFNGMGETILRIFGEEQPAQFIPQNGPPKPVEVIFNAIHQDVDLSGQVIGGPNPTAWIRTGLISPEYNDKIRIENSGTYLITSTEDDGLELTRLNLDVVIDE